MDAFVLLQEVVFGVQLPGLLCLPPEGEVGGGEHPTH